LKHPADITIPNPTESGARPSLGHGVLGRFLGHTRDTGRKRPESVEIDAKLHSTHVRPAAFRPELY
jgi:hypothetical protein